MCKLSPETTWPGHKLETPTIASPHHLLLSLNFLLIWSRTGFDLSNKGLSHSLNFLGRKFSVFKISFFLNKRIEWTVYPITANTLDVKRPSRGPPSPHSPSCGVIVDVSTQGNHLIVTSLGQWRGRSIWWEAESSNDITATGSQIAAGCCVMNVMSLNFK